MQGPECFSSLFAYGPAPGMEFIPYFLGLAAWAGMAFLAILLSPFSAFIRRFRRAKKTPPDQTSNEDETAARRESSGEVNRNGS